MPYTQANAIDQSVRDALDRKVYLLRKRIQSSESDAALFYFNNRTPWIKMTSAVDVVGKVERDQFKLKTKEELANRFVLTSAYSEEHLPAQHSNTSLGIRPRPGIQNMHVTSHNQFGSLRTATVNFQVWSKEDLDACEVLYMRPGMSVLLEWGWSLYLEGKEENIKVKQMEKGFDIFKSNENSLIGVLARLGENKRQYGHDYDGIFGFVKNFSWSLRPDGGYDCKTDIVSPGELVESLNIAQPVSDNDAKEYNDFKTDFSDAKGRDIKERIGKLDEATDQSLWDRIKSVAPFLGSPVLAAGAISAQVVAEDIIEEYRKQLVEELQALNQNIPDYKTQTALATFFEIDIKLAAQANIEAKLEANSNLQSSEQLNVVLADFDLTSLKKGNTYTKRLFSVNSDLLEPYKHMRLVNWSTTEYQKKASGELVLDADNEPITQENKLPQYYIKYGLVLEILNRFMLHNGDSPIVSFDISKDSTFNPQAAEMISLDPSSCILPNDMAFMEERYKVRYITAGEGDPINPNYPSGPSTQATNSTAITDIYLNIDMVEDLITSSNIRTFTSDGIPQIKMFNFIEKINQAINQACAGIMELGIQYFEDEGKYSIIDRVNFAENTDVNYKIALLGRDSILRELSVSSALTPTMASSLAISVQTDFKAHNNTEAGFLRFNEGLQDRILSNRNPIGKFSNSAPRENYTLTQDELARVETLYNLVYGEARWMPYSFEYAREIHHKYVTEILNAASGEIPAHGRTVVPFVSTLTLDGTSGVKILNSLLLDNELLPYSYAKIKGGVGVLVTGLEATVDAGGWSTILKAHYYARNSGALTGVRKAIKEATQKQEEPGDHILYDFADEAAQQDFTKYQSSSGFFRSNLNQIPTPHPRLTGLSDFIKQHYKTYWEGGVTEITEDRISSVDKKIDPILPQYWSPLGKGFSQHGRWDAFEKNKACPSTPWSAVYVSYILNNFNAPYEDPDTGTLYDSITDFLFGDENQYRYTENLGFPYRAAHWQYAKQALNKLKAEQGNGWVFIPLTVYGGVVQAEIGDVLVTPRKGNRYTSHGVIVHDISVGDKTVTVAGGNESNTNKIDTKVDIDVSTRQVGSSVQKIPVYKSQEKQLGDYVGVLKYYGDV